MRNENIYLPVGINGKYLGDFKIKIIFDNGVTKVVNFKKWLKDGIFEELKDENKFKEFFVDGWTISWPNGANIAPETLYEDEE